MTSKRTAHTPLLEWVIGGAGALLFAAILTTILLRAANDEHRPPSIVVYVRSIEPVENGYAVSFEARNTGDSTAAQVRIAGVVTNAGAQEEHEAVLDYLPPHSRRRGGLWFSNDPRQGQLTLAADGWSDP